jgi:hypothetical protein
MRRSSADLNSTSGNKIDFMLTGTTPWKVAQLEHAKPLSVFPDLDVHIASPEDVILGKLTYYREGGSEKHLRDILGILRISGDLLDRVYLAQVADRLGVLDIWESILNFQFPQD